MASRFLLSTILLTSLFGCAETPTAQDEDASRDRVRIHPERDAQPVAVMSLRPQNPQWRCGTDQVTGPIGDPRDRAAETRLMETRLPARTYEDQPLGRVLRWVERRAKVRIVVLPSAYRTLLTDGNGLRIDMDLGPVSALTGLEEIVTSVGLDYTIRQGVVTVGAADDLHPKRGRPFVISVPGR